MSTHQHKTHLLVPATPGYGYGNDSVLCRAPHARDHAEFRGMRSSLPGPSVLDHSGQFLLRMIKCPNQIASRNASGDSLKQAITSTLVKRELSTSYSSWPVGQTRRACQDHAEYTTSTASRKRRAERLLRVHPFPTPHAPELRMIGTNWAISP